MEMLKYARPLVLGDARPSVGHADSEVTSGGSRCHAHLARIRELDGVADEVEKHLGQTLLVAETNRQRLRHLCLEQSFLVSARDSVAARTVSTMLSIAYSAMFKLNCPDSILAMSSTVLIRPSRCLPLERMRVERVE